MRQGGSMARMVADHIGAGKLLVESLGEAFGYESKEEVTARERAFELAGMDDLSPEHAAELGTITAKYKDLGPFVRGMLDTRERMGRIAAGKRQAEAEGRRINSREIANRLMEKGDYVDAARVYPRGVAQVMTARTAIRNSTMQEINVLEGGLAFGMKQLQRAAAANPNTRLKDFLKGFKADTHGWSKDMRESVGRLLHSMITDEETGQVMTGRQLQKALRTDASAIDLLNLAKRDKAKAEADEAMSKAEREQNKIVISGLTDELKRLGTLDPADPDVAARQTDLQDRLDGLLGVAGRRVGGGDPRLTAGDPESVRRGPGPAAPAAGPGPEPAAAAPGPSPALSPEMERIHEPEDIRLPETHMKRTARAVTGGAEVSRGRGGAREAGPAGRRGTPGVAGADGSRATVGGRNVGAGTRNCGRRTSPGTSPSSTSGTSPHSGDRRVES